MSKKRKNRNKKKNNHNFGLINSLFSPSGSSKKKQHNLKFDFVEFVEQADSQSFIRYIKTILNNNYGLLEFFSPKHSSIDSFFNRKEPQIYASEARLLDIYEVSFTKNSITIQDFINFKNKYEQLFLTGKYSECLDQLEDSILKFGYTFWYVRNKLTVLGIENNSEKLSEFYKDISKNINNEIFIHYIVTSVFRLSNSASPKLVYQSTIEKDTRELNEAKLAWAASTISYITAPNLDDNTQLSEGLLTGFQNSFSLYDQYVFVIDWLIHVSTQIYFTEDNNELLDSLNFCIDKLKKINNEVQDRNIEKCLEIHSNNIESNQCEAGKKVIQLYTYGYYKEVIDMLNNNYDEFYSPETYIGIFAKSAAYQGTPYSDNSNIIKSITSKISELLLTSKDSALIVDEINAIKYKTHHLSFMKSIDATLQALCPDFFGGDTVLMSSLSYIFSQETHPKCLSLLTGSNEYEVLKDLDLTNLPGYRKMKYRISNSSTMNNELLEETLNEIQNSNDLSVNKIITTTEILKIPEHFDHLTSFCSNSLIKNENHYLFLPMNKIAQFLDDYDNPRTPSLDNVIVSYFYVKHVNRTKQHILNEALDDFLDHMEVERPSELLSRFDEFGSSKALLFFQEICQENTMDYLTCFQASIELKIERLEILDYLYDNKQSNSNLIDEERENIYKSIITESALLNLSKGKININTQGVKDRVFDEINSLIEQYVASEDTSGIEFIEDPTEQNPFGGRSNDNEVISTIVASGKNSLIERILNISLESFLFDENYGLDKSLSTDIRHGFFSNFMRSKLQEEHLIIETNTDEKSFWYKEYKRVALETKALNGIESSLKKFSEEYQTLLKKAEEWMKISITFEDSKLFDYSSFDSEFITSIQKLLETRTSTSDIINFLLDTYLKRTESNIKRIQSKINNEFRHDVNKLLDSITDELPLNSLIDLTNSITTVKGIIQADITHVTEWFELSNSSEIFVNDAEQLVNISIESFKHIQNYPIQFHVTGETFPLLNEKHSRPLITALINCYDNAIKYGKDSKNTIIRINLSQTTNNNFSIKVINQISKEKAKELQTGKLSFIQKEIEEINPSKMTMEGGTGLVKAKHQLFHIDKHYNLTAELNDLSFEVEIIYA